MAGITLTQAQAQLDAYVAASLAIAGGGQSYSINGRSFTRANLGEINKQITFWDMQVKRLAGGRSGPRVRYGVFG